MCHYCQEGEQRDILHAVFNNFQYLCKFASTIHLSVYACNFKEVCYPRIIFINLAFLKMLSTTTRGALSSISLTTERAPPLRILLPTFFVLHFMPLYCILLCIIIINCSWLL